MANDGCVEIILSREWCGHAPGEAVRVDPMRAEWMQENGYEQAFPDVIEAPAVRAKRVPTSKRKQQAFVIELEPEPSPEGPDAPEPAEGEEFF